MAAWMADLTGGLDLAGPGGCDHTVLFHGNQPKAGHGKLPEEHHSDDPAGNLAVFDKPAHGGENQHFVSQRVHEFAEVRDLMIVTNTHNRDSRISRKWDHLRAGANPEQTLSGNRSAQPVSG